MKNIYQESQMSLTTIEEDNNFKKEIYTSNSYEYWFKQVKPRKIIYTVKEKCFENYIKLLNKVLTEYRIYGNNFDYNLDELYIKIKNEYHDDIIYFREFNPRYFKYRILKRESKVDK